ncbi:MAG: radical SAM family heme chaperone HemW [Clostridiales bacterium]|nr:radical SAM family heme chaperone HemW [Clostridiales bacterium]
MQMSLYVHFPFCRSKCVYCDFCSFAADDSVIEGYCASLTKEMELAAQYTDAEIQTVYFGGGTPSVVPTEFMRRVTRKLRGCFHIPRGIEFTSEANPGTVTDAWLAAMAEAGMNRLSVGMQAKQDRILKLLGRIHRFSQVKDTLDMARKHGIGNLSVDLMYGLPTQTVEEYLDSIRAAAELGVKHISSYALKVEDGTKLQTMLENGELTLPDEDDIADMMERGAALLASLGYRRYEISNFAVPGFESRHNLAYWRQRYYLGLGLNAASMLPAENVVYLRRSNTASLAEYLSALSQNRLPVGDIILIDTEEAMFETVMLGLRTTDGVGYTEFEAMHGRKLNEVYGEAIAILQSEGWLRPPDPAEPRLALNERGLALQNTALMPFMKENEGEHG